MMKADVKEVEIFAMKEVPKCLIKIVPDWGMESGVRPAGSKKTLIEKGSHFLR